MQICVFGAGAIGSFLTAKLAAAGADVRLIARGAQLAAIGANGLKLQEAAGETVVEVPVSDNPADFGPQDILVVATKAHGLKAAAAACRPLLGPETKVVFAQNGVPWWYAYGFEAPGLPPGPLATVDPDGAVWDGFGPERAVGCSIFSPNSVPAPGVVRNVAIKPSTYVLGQPDGEVGPVLRAFAAQLEAAGVRAPVTTDIRREVWGKIVFNVGSASVATLTGATIRANVQDAGLREVTKALSRETMAVAAAHGFDLDIDVDALTDPATRPDHKPSLLQDFEAGRQMEVDAIPGGVASLAGAAGVPTPTLDTVLALVRTKARTAGLYREAGN